MKFLSFFKSHWTRDVILKFTPSILDHHVIKIIELLEELFPIIEQLIPENF